MELRENAVDRGRLARTALAVVLTVVAITSLRQGKRLRGALAGAGAVALGYQTTTGSDAMTELEFDQLGSEEQTDSRDDASADDGLRCAACGEPIVPGQARGPNENHEIVHEACEAASA